MKFSAIPADLRVGDTIEWVNEDIFLHTAIAKDKSFDVVLKPKMKGRTVLTTAGPIPFVGRYHPGIKGVLTIAK
jgi:plastocyanin